MIDDLVFAKAGRHLDQAEKVIIEAAWEDKDYKEVAEKSPYTVDRLQRDVGRKLWILLTGILGNGKKVTKKRLRSIVEQSITPPSSNILSDSSDRSQPKPDKTLLQVIGGQPPDTFSFYGRTEELTNLKEWMVRQRCVSLLGVAGIGKSALAAKLIEEISVEPQAGFDCLIWKSVAYAPLLQDLVAELIKLANPLKPELDLPEYTQARISVLIEQLQARRCLLVLDAAEALLQGNNLEQYTEYGLFFRRLVEEQHQSCLLITSRVPFDELDSLAAARRPVQSLKLEGLDTKAGLQLLLSKGLTETNKCQELIQTYRGNPSELETVANRINHFFAGSTDRFFEHKTTFVSNRFQAMLNQQFGQAGLLSELQRQIMIYLAEELSRNFAFISFTKILSDLSLRQEVSVSTSELITAIEGLEERSLIESSKNSATKEISFALEPVVRKYILTDPLGLVRKSSTTIKSA